MKEQLFRNKRKADYTKDELFQLLLETDELANELIEYVNRVKWYEFWRYSFFETVTGKISKIISNR